MSDIRISQDDSGVRLALRGQDEAGPWSAELAAPTARELLAALNLTRAALALQELADAARQPAGVTGIDCPGPRDSQHDCSPGSCETEPVPLAIELSEAERFFYEHAGYSYDPESETPEHGRMRGAVLLAEAEKSAARLGADVTWEDEPEPYDGDDGYEGPCYCAVLRNSASEVIASLGMVAFASGTPDGEPYARVVAAELALEAL